MLKQLLLISCWLVIAGTALGATPTDSILRRLDEVMANRPVYDAEKEKHLQALARLAQRRSLSPAEQYEAHLQLIEAYQKYQVDSAVAYVRKNRAIAATLNDPIIHSQTAIQQAWLYATEGLYIESKSLLDSIDRASLSPGLLPYYYETYLLFYSRYGQSTDNIGHYQMSERYRDSLLSVLDPRSLNHQITEATKTLYQGQELIAESTLLTLLGHTTDEDPERALIAYLLGVIYKNRGDADAQLRYFAISAITDVVHAIKDNASLQSLALTYYDRGNVEQAYRFMDASINDAIFCNARYRTVENSMYYPIINASFRALEQAQKTKLHIYLILISLLSVGLIIGIVYSYVQVRRLARTRRALSLTNQRLNNLNQVLKDTNDSLFEANHIKEEYIAHFFDICSLNIEKLEDYRKSLHKKASAGKYEQLLQELKSTDLAENELAELYHNFDTIFLNLYPTFVSEFNGLLLPDEQILPKPGELLNTELRIFALVRLGISDSVKIAGFLRYSLRTVYNYRTKIRQKARHAREEFEAQVRQIGTIRKLN